MHFCADATVLLVAVSSAFLVDLTLAYQGMGVDFNVVAYSNFSGRKILGSGCTSSYQCSGGNRCCSNADCVNGAICQNAIPIVCLAVGGACSQGTCYRNCDCPPNTYSSTGKDTDGNGGGCTNCPSGKTSSTGSTECTTPCSYGPISSAGANLCKCPTSDGECTSAVCSAAFPTTYSGNGVVSMFAGMIFGRADECSVTISATPKQDTCKCCMPGGYLKDLLPPICALPPMPCPANTYSSTGIDNDGGGGGCSACPPGKASSSGTTACITTSQCPANTYSSSGRDNNGNGGGCTLCSYGKTSPVGATVCVAPCPAGRYSASGNDNNGLGGGCSSCSSGSISSSGATACIVTAKCPINTYSSTGRDTDGKGRDCIACSPGTKTVSDGSTYCPDTITSNCVCFCCLGSFCKESVVGAFFAASSVDCKAPACNKQFPLLCPDANSNGMASANYLQDPSSTDSPAVIIAQTPSPTAPSQPKSSGGAGSRIAITQTTTRVYTVILLVCAAVLALGH
jgi:hypothetical protein